MESRLPKLNNFKFKVPAKMETGNSTSSSTLKLVSNSNGTKASTSNSVQHTLKNVSTANLTTRKADENKAPATRANTAARTLSRVNPTTTRGTVKRPGLVNTTVEPKRANLKTTMKPNMRPVRPQTIAGALPKAKTVAAPTTSNNTTKQAAPKPSKWDLKGRLEHTSSELTLLKQKHKDISSQYNDIQEEIQSLRKSESTCRSKVEKLEKTANDLKTQNEVLKEDIEKLERERDSLSAELKVTKELYEKASKSLTDCKKDLTAKTDLVEKQTEEISDLNTNVNNLKTKCEDLSELVSSMDRERRALHNYIQELKGNIRVFCRVRPKIPKEASKKYV